MKNKKILFTAIAILAVFISGFGFQSSQQPQQGKTPQDSIAKNAAVADSLKLVSNLKLKVFKKNAHASYYHDKFNGKRTASGRKFSNKGYTAAHRKLAFGTKLKVTNEANGKSVIVEVTDRGPFTRGRDIDLTKKAFMDIAGSGWGGALKVTIEVIE
ncbi:septal ring lytic transglycosylase RlpA family protein [Flavobacterium sp. MAH-1]|uniref:Septal ring lytic transglycosylase RlpA family protein n=1 Tax=Flavobacterium agri TaxID=2743471 RepID=A0A7Y9C7G2_9FLAO|nr:septal ring lytic transglycosylase RlpA family protein [Flavobacterium agri]NUY81303.1 septal ring lytic transglycosylase RlpA family protein [Flavobacterium agri]NYA71327.1 septal ring lytic transglycosylase RlpA family protein [Flavobacterium agri]